jgi:uncharacterized YigZ family protein
MKIIDKIYANTHEVKQSKFIAHLMPYSEYFSTLEKLKESNPKARHFVVAYRYLNEFNQVLEHSSDDGEPKGTSGKPSLFVLQGHEMINCAVIIVRYFGGTKLGTGGLVRAYSDSVNFVLNEASLIEYKHEISKNIYFEYTNIRMIEYECLACGIDIIEKSFDVATSYKVKANESDMKMFLEKVERLITIIS